MSSVGESVIETHMGIAQALSEQISFEHSSFEGCASGLALAATIETGAEISAALCEVVQQERDERRTLEHPDPREIALDRLCRVRDVLAHWPEPADAAALLDAINRETIRLNKHIEELSLSQLTVSAEGIAELRKIVSWTFEEQQIWLGFRLLSAYVRFGVLDCGEALGLQRSGHLILNYVANLELGRELFVDELFHSFQA